MFSLGELYISDFLNKDQQPTDPWPLELIMDDDIGAARLSKVVRPDLMFGRYWYKSGTNETMKAALKDIVNSILPLKSGGRWLDIACNDGTLLSYVPKEFVRIGIDPSENSIRDKAIKHCDYHYQEYFPYEPLKNNGNKILADVITTIAMFYDAVDPDEFIMCIHDVLHDEGLWVIQMSYTPLMLKQLAFDNICHEHVYYHSLSSMRTLLERNGFKIVDCTLNDVNGGSFRLFVRKKIANPKNFGSQPYRDVCKYRLSALYFKEAIEAVDEKNTWLEFYANILKLKAEIIEFITHAKERGKTIMGYGASTKGNTLLQFFGLDHTMIDAIAERQPEKWGLRTVGSNIPIISEEEMRKAQPDYLLILPWHFISEFEKREAEYLRKGGKFIVPLPRFEIISA